MPLVDQLPLARSSAVSIVGLAKNCGKTTTLNHLVEQWSLRGVTVGITSIGRDGESEDLITRLPKPRIPVPVGSLAVTAEQSLSDSSAACEVVRDTGIGSALGELKLVRVMQPGFLEMSGPGTNTGLKEAVRLLQEAGAERVLIDGALSRLSSSSPSICGSVILACGAVLGSSPTAVAAKVRHQVELFRLPQPEADDRPLLERAACVAEGSAAAVTAEGHIQVLPSSAVQCRGLGSGVSGGTRWLWIGGGLTDQVLRDLSACKCPPELMVRDASCVLLSPQALAAWRLGGGKILVLERCHLAAITACPWRPHGRHLSPVELVKEVSRSTPEAPVYDVVAGLKAVSGASLEIPESAKWAARAS